MVGYETVDAVDLAALIRAGETTATEVVEAAISRIERFNPALNAVVTKLYDLGREMAAQPAAGPFAGVPLLLKDIGGDVAGVETRSGSRFKQGVAAAQDQTIVRRYRRAGLVFLGKTNVPELGMNPITTSVLYGPARNPWNPDFTTGGSSGGAAAAVAMGLVPIAHGGDAGGSIRMPASCCGVVGLKPTRGRNPAGPVFGSPMAGYLQEHVLTRTVRDSAAMLDCTHGHEPGDPYFAPPIERSFLEETQRRPGRFRVAVSTAGPEGQQPDKACRDAVALTVKALGDLGHEVEEAQPPHWARLFQQSMVIGAACIAHEIVAHAKATGARPDQGNLEPRTWDLYQAGLGIDAATYLAAVSEVELIARQIAAFMQTFDVWLTPTLPAPPSRLDAAMVGADQAATTTFAPIAYAIVANATGQPSISLPLHWTESGLPVGVSFTGRFGDEAGLFRLAAQLELARPWSGRRPAMWT